MTSIENPAAHIEFIESAGSEYEAVTAHAATYRRRVLAKRVVGLLLFIPYIGLAYVLASKENGWRVVTIAAVGLLVLGFIFWAMNNETLKAARRGVWSKSCAVVVEAGGEVSTTPAYLVLRQSGVYVQEISTEKWRAQFRTAHAFLWPDLISIEFTRRGSRWRAVVIAGPGVRIAPLGSVDAGFADALRELGAAPPE